MNGRSIPETVSVAQFEASVMWAFPIEVVIQSGTDTFSAIAADPQWLSDLASKLTSANAVADTGNPFTRIEKAKSAYSRSVDRGTADTLKAVEVRDMMPLGFVAEEALHAESGGLAWKFDRLHLSPAGAVSFRFAISQATNGEIPVTELISAYHTTLRAARSDLDRWAQEFFKLWDGHVPGVQLRSVLPDTLEAYLITYEAIDTGLVVRDGERRPIRQPIKTMYDEDFIDVVRQLAALSRMSDVESIFYDWNRLEQFRRADVGNREDEMWLVNSGRMLRSHPDRDEDRNRLYYQDAVLLAELMLQYRSSISYVDHWLRAARKSLRDSSHALGKSARSGALSDHQQVEDDLGQVVVGVERISDHLTDPTELLLGIRHPFFRSLAEALAETMQVDVAVRSGQQAVSQFLASAQSTYSHGLALGQRHTSRQTRRLTVASLIAAVAAAAAAIASLVVAIDQDPGDAQPDPPAVDVQTDAGTLPEALPDDGD